jgi:hypothetical protein
LVFVVLAELRQPPAAVRRIVRRGGRSPSAADIARAVRAKESDESYKTRVRDESSSGTFITLRASHVSALVTAVGGVMEHEQEVSTPGRAASTRIIRPTTQRSAARVAFTGRAVAFGCALGAAQAVSAAVFPPLLPLSSLLPAAAATVAVDSC